MITRRQKLVMGGVIAGLLLLFSLLIFSSGSSSRDQNYVLSDSLSPRDSARVFTQLNREKVPYRIVKENAIGVPGGDLYEEHVAVTSLGIPEEGRAEFERADEKVSDQSAMFRRTREGEMPKAAGDASSFGALSAMQQQYKQREENKKERKIVNVLAPIVGGSEHVVAKVTVEFDYSQKHSTSESYDPNGVVRSEEQSEALYNGSTASAGRTATSDQPLQRSRRTRYELSKTLTTTRENHARIKRITAAVVIDENTAPDDEAERRLDEITTLVKRSIGIDEKRGDQVSVRRFRFSKRHTEAELPVKIPAQERSGLIALVEPYTPLFKSLLVVLIAWIVFKAVVKPLLKSGEKPPRESGGKNKPSGACSAAVKAEREQGLPEEEVPDMAALLDKVRASASHSPKEVAILLQALMEQEKKSGKEKLVRTLRREG